MMHRTLIISLILILFTPACSAMSPIQPTITVTLPPTTVNINSSADFKMSLIIAGEVKMDKPPLVRETVDLTSEVDAGWATSCSPSEMLITDESPYSFTCTVIIPEMTPNTTTKIKVRAMSNGGGFVVTGFAEATIIVHGTASTNKTKDNGTTNMTIDNETETLPTNYTGPNADKWVLNHYSSYLMPVIILVAVAVVGSGTYVVYRKRTARRQRPE
jgi:hypothetical protein